MKQNVYVSIDPGSTGTGLAVWSVEDWAKPVCPLAVKNIYPDSDTQWPLNCYSVAMKFEEFITNYNVTGAYCEMPQFWNNAGGQMTAGKGDLQKLTFMVGALAQCCWSHNIPIKLFEVNEWKGQLPKDLVIRRIKQRIPAISQMKVSSHSWDAVGIGLFAKGILKV